MQNVFDTVNCQTIVQRIQSLTPETQAKWGKMSVSQALAHLSVSYDMLYTDKFTKPNAFARFLLKSFIKPIVVGPKAYPKNSRTAKDFLITNSPEFQTEQEKLIHYIWKVQAEGATAFHLRESNSFGKLTSDEWNALFYKHLDHHLTQFGV